jgi:hypothetical protein
VKFIFTYPLFSYVHDKNMWNTYDRENLRCLEKHMRRLISTQENFPRKENFPKIPLLKVENFQLFWRKICVGHFPEWKLSWVEIMGLNWGEIIIRQLHIARMIRTPMKGTCTNHCAPKFPTPLSQIESQCDVIVFNFRCRLLAIICLVWNLAAVHLQPVMRKQSY